MHWDEIDGLATEAIQALKTGVASRVLELLSQIKGYATAQLVAPTVWELIQADYESGLKPRRLALKYQSYGITVKQIYSRANVERWISATKLKKAYTTAKNRSKNTFYPKCRECERPFEATSGAAIVCPTCKALKVQEDSTRKWLGRES